MTDAAVCCRLDFFRIGFFTFVFSAPLSSATAEVICLVWKNCELLQP
jgi:hypothetical protein